MQADRKLQLVGKPGVFRVPVDERKVYLTHQHGAVRGLVAKAILARPRGVGRRPERHLYDTAEGSRSPLGSAFRQIEGLAKLRDHATTPELIATYDECIRGIAWVLMDYADDAIDASDKRRDDSAGAA